MKNSLSLLAGIFSAAILFYAATALVFVPAISQAALVPVCAATGNCGVCDIVNVFITLGRWLIMGAGGLVLLIIVNASFGLVTSAGNPEKIGGAKKQITGAILGMLITFAAFQLVAILVMILATPSGLRSYEAQTQVGDTPAKRAGSLANFLEMPWWTICNADELKKQNGAAAFPSTANCAYWGDGTSCSETQNKICCAGACQSGECVQVASLPSFQAPGVGGGDEEAVRDQLRASGVRIEKDPCQGSQTVGCANVAGLGERAIAGLASAAQYCNGCILITGGTEPGHVSHGLGLSVVDVAYSPAAISALGSAGIQRANPNFSRGYTCEANGGPIDDCSKATWLHVEF